MYKDAELCFTGDINKYAQQMIDAKKNLVFLWAGTPIQGTSKKKHSIVLMINEKHRID